MAENHLFFLPSKNGTYLYKMQQLKNEIINRFGEANVSIIGKDYGDFFLIKSSELSGSLLITTDLSDYKMMVHEKHQGEEFAELYFYLPSYWDIHAVDNPTMNWVFPWLNRVQLYVQNNATWLGHGHTMPCGKEMQCLSSTMTQNHFIVSKPIACEKFLSPMIVGDKTIHFLALIPLFPDEMDYKQGKGTAKLFDKFRAQGVTEKLDDYRKSTLKSKWKFFGK